MVVDQVSTDLGKSTQDIQLTLLDRTASAEFYHQFPSDYASASVSESPERLGQNRPDYPDQLASSSNSRIPAILDYARAHGTVWIDQPSTAGVRSTLSPMNESANLFGVQQYESKTMLRIPSLLIY